MAQTDGQTVTPWEVKGAVVDGLDQGIDYDKLVLQFGASRITPELLQRWEKVTCYKPFNPGNWGKTSSVFITRTLFLSQRCRNDP
jgi:tryptophanyl-tRNA synthetase